MDPTTPPTITEISLPPESLLAGFAGADDYTDCYAIDVPRAVSLQNYITAFYNSPAFRPERWALHLIGKGSGAEEVRQLAAGETKNFAAWGVIGRTETEILLQDFQHRTCSWLMVSSSSSEAVGQKETQLATNAPTIASRTRLHFGSGVRKHDGKLVRALMPFHRFYAKTLLSSAGKRLLCREIEA